jgi:hypothetical protein
MSPLTVHPSDDYWRKPDIRIKRLVVAITESSRLNEYFYNRNHMMLLCTYLDLNMPRTSLDGIISWLDVIYTSNPETFRQLIQYALNKVMPTPTIASIRKELEAISELIELFNGFTHFIIELNSLGFSYNYATQQVIPITDHIEEDVKIQSEIDIILRRLSSQSGSDYVSKRQGAWDTLLSESHDRYPQAVSSIRDLLSAVLRQLAPDKETRKSRVKAILTSDTETDLVNSIANTIDELYGLQSKIHVTETAKMLDYESALFAIKTTEYLLYFLLKRAKI